MESDLGRYVLRRLLSIVPVILGVTIVVFLLIKLVPGDVASVLLGPEATPVEIEALRKALGLDEPLQVQYFRWLGSAIQGDLGDSIEYRVPVQALIFGRLGNTLILTLTALFLSTSVGVTIGVISATRQHSFFDRIGMLVALFGNSMPAFWLGMLLILTFSLRLSWFPVGGMYSIRGDEGLLDLAHHLVLPAIALGSLSMAIIARMTRSCMLDVLTQDYVWVARAKGLKEHTVVLVHALRNALPPVATVVGLRFGTMLGGAVLTEIVFSWPGVGRQLYQAISTRDLPVIQGGILLIALGFVFINLMVEILNAYLDPRVRPH